MRIEVKNVRFIIGNQYHEKDIVLHSDVTITMNYLGPINWIGSVAGIEIKILQSSPMSQIDVNAFSLDDRILTAKSYFRDVIKEQLDWKLS